MNPHNQQLLDSNRGLHDQIKRNGGGRNLPLSILRQVYRDEFNVVYPLDEQSIDSVLSFLKALYERYDKYLIENSEKK